MSRRREEAIEEVVKARGRREMLEQEQQILDQEVENGRKKVFGTNAPRTGLAEPQPGAYC